MRLYDYVASPNCYKVRLLLAQLGIEYERVPVDIFGGDTLEKEYADVNPSRRTPVLEPEPGKYIPESAAIPAVRRAGRGAPPALPGQTRQGRPHYGGPTYPTPGGVPRV